MSIGDVQTFRVSLGRAALPFAAFVAAGIVLLVVPGPSFDTEIGAYWVPFGVIYLILMLRTAITIGDDHIQVRTLLHPRRARFDRGETDVEVELRPTPLSSEERTLCFDSRGQQRSVRLRLYSSHDREELLRLVQQTLR